MNEIKFLESGKNTAFVIEEEGARVAEVVVGISNGEMSAYHTEVAPQLEGKGVGKKLVGALADYARKHQMKVIPLCPYVQVQFARNEKQYGDIWKKEGQ